MTKELHYFDTNALGEHIRYILHYTKQKFNDVRIRYDVKWPDQKIKATLPYGQVPVYKEGDKTLHQSLAIAKYVARGTNLIPTDPWEQAVLESIAYTIYDFWTAVLPYIRESDLDKKYQLKKKLIDETIDFFFSRFEKLLKENDGFFIGKLTWVEFVLCSIVEASNLFLNLELEKKYPKVAAVVEKINNLPGVKEYVKTRGPYKLPFKTTQFKDLDLLDLY